MFVVVPVKFCVAYAGKVVGLLIGSWKIINYLSMHGQ